ncbi:hypothetical protein [Clostridium sp. ZBS13]|nr:hypothetical protein [Clostridium sp. ZBS13]
MVKDTNVPNKGNSRDGFRRYVDLWFSTSIKKLGFNSKAIMYLKRRGI